MGLFLRILTFQLLTDHCWLNTRILSASACHPMVIGVCYLLSLKVQKGRKVYTSIWPQAEQIENYEIDIQGSIFLLKSWHCVTAFFYMKYGPCHGADSLETWLAGSQQVWEGSPCLGQSASWHKLVKLAFFSRLLSCYLSVGNLRNYLWIIHLGKKVGLRAYWGQKRDTNVHSLETLMAEGKLWTNSWHMEIFICNLTFFI